MAGEIIKPARVADLIAAPTIDYPSWINPVLLPKGGLFLFGGHSKIGKSFLALEMARALAVGDTMFGYEGFKAEECRVLYLEREIGEYGMQSRTREVFRDADISKYADNLWYVSQDPELNVDKREGMLRIADHVSNLGINVLILDPISHMFSVEENSATEMAQVFHNLEKLRALFRNHGLSIAMAHHFGKPPAAKFQDDYDHLSFHNFRGSSRFFSAPDTIMTSWRFEEMNLGWEAWKLRCRFVCRQGSSPPEMVIAFNQRNDLRMRFERAILDNRAVTAGARKVVFSPSTRR